MRIRLTSRQLRELIQEDLIRGRKLEWIVTQLSRWIVNQIKSLDDENTFNSPRVTKKIDFPAEIVDQVDQLDRGWVYLQRKPAVGPAVEASFSKINFDDDAGKIVLVIYFGDSPIRQQLDLLISNIKDALRHELEHSTQTHREDDVRLPAFAGPLDTIDNLRLYLSDPHEIAAFSAGFVKASKTSKIPVSDIVTDYALGIYRQAVQAGLDRAEASSITMNHRREILSYVKKRWSSAA